MGVQVAAARRQLAMNLFGHFAQSAFGGSWLDTWVPSVNVAHFNSMSPGPLKMEGTSGSCEYVGIPLEKTVNALSRRLNSRIGCVNRSAQ